MRGQVLFAGTGQQIGSLLMPGIGAERSLRPCRAEELFVRQTVVHGQQPAARQRGRSLTPPIHRGRAGFRGEAVGQHGLKRGRQHWPIRNSKGGARSALFRRGSRVAALICQPLLVCVYRSPPVLWRSGFEWGRDLVAFLCFWSRNVAAEDGSTPAKQ